MEEQINEIMTLILAMSVVVNRIVETAVKPLLRWMQEEFGVSDDTRKWTTMVFALLIGVIASGIVAYNPLRDLVIYGYQIPHAAALVIVGLLIGAGANGVHFIAQIVTLIALGRSQDPETRG